MADPITIISLISAIVSLIDYGTKVGKRLKEYTSGLKKIPEAFIDISIQLPLVLRNLDRIKERLRHQNITSQIADTVSDVATQCEKHVKVGCSSGRKILPWKYHLTHCRLSMLYWITYFQFSETRPGAKAKKLS